jgi:hypothetical protein
MAASPESALFANYLFESRISHHVAIAREAGGGHPPRHGLVEAAGVPDGRCE